MRILIILSLMVITSCNPYMHINANYMRRYNMSMNQYNKQTPYIGTKEVKPMKKHREHRFWFWLMRNI